MKNTYSLLTILCLLASTPLFAQISNTFDVPTSISPSGTIPDPSAILDVQSTTKGMLVPRMTSTQRNIISNPATGLLVFDTDTGSFWFYDSGSWVNLIGGSGDNLGNHTATQELDMGNFKVNNLQEPADPQDAATKAYVDNNDAVDDADADPTNELQNWSNLPGIPTGFSDDVDNVDDADADPTNELQNWSNLPGIPTGFSDGIDNVDDADADPTNELQNWSNLPGIPTGFSDNVDNVDDADADPANELQNLSISGSDLSISNGNTVSLPVRTLLEDADMDTKIQVEEDADEDIIRMDLAGNEAIVIKKNNPTGDFTVLEMPNNSENMFLGQDAGLENTTGFRNTFLGFWAGRKNEVGINNTFYGGFAGRNMTSGSNNTFIGTYAGSNHLTSGFNTFIGYAAGSENTNGTGNIFIGNQAGENETGSNLLYIENSNSSTPLIWGDFNNDLLGINGKLGVGTTAPLAQLQVEGGAVLFEGVTGTTPVSGAGTRFMWIPAKKAFRAGQVTGTQWDDLNIGNASAVSGGQDNTASGSRSFVGGGAVNTASNSNSFVGGGDSNIASGNSSFVGGGIVNTASGFNSFVGGGRGNEAKSIDETVFGSYSTDYTPSGNGIFIPDPNDRLFAIGNGTSDSNRSNALTVLKNGNFGIGTDNPSAKLDVEGNVLLNRGTTVNALTRSLTLQGARNADADPFASIDFNNFDDNNNAVTYTGARITSHNTLSTEEGDLRFFTNDGTSLTQRMTIDETGQVGIGITDPIASLDIQGGIHVSGGSNTVLYSGPNATGTPADDAFRIRTDGTFFGSINDALVIEKTDFNQTDPDGGIAFVNTGSDGVVETALVIRGDGDIGIGLDNPGNIISVAGGANCDGSSWNDSSDRRLKQQIKAIDYGLSEVLQLKPVQYEMKKDGDQQIGFIAQEVREILPEVVSGIEGDLEKGETLSMSYGHVTAVLVKAMQEQQEEIESLKNQLSEIDALKAELRSILQLIQQGDVVEDSDR